jgi:hypothetical protein
MPVKIPWAIRDTSADVFVNVPSVALGKDGTIKAMVAPMHKSA